MITIFFGIGFLLSSTILTISLKKNLEFMEKIDEVTDAIQESIEILAEQHEIMDKKSKIEVFSDEPIVRSLVQDIAIAKNAVLRVAKKLDDSLDEEDGKFIEEEMK